MTTHTPGPWRVVTDPRKSSKLPLIATASETPYVVTAVHGSPREANARLIAAAPELLAALQDLLLVAEEELDRHRTPEIGMARAAIAKAVTP
jgi:hypothetical protein